MRKPCVVCGDPVHGHGYCSKHWQRWVKFGDPLAMARKPYIRGTYAERFWSHVDKTETCWIWTGKKGSKGYGLAHKADRSGQQQAHRAAYELVVGEIPGGLELDHLCEVRACVNPAHLEPVTHAENIRRRYSRQVSA